MSRKGRRKDLMERELLSCAADLFARKGYGGVTLRDIADKAGVGRTTLYHYFGSKEDILAALFEDQTSATFNDLHGIHERSDIEHRQKLYDAIYSLALRVLEDPMRFRVVEREEANLGADLVEAQKQTRRKALDELVSIIDAGMAAGQIRSMDSRLAAFFVFGMTNWPAWWFNPNGPRSPADLATEISRFMLDALSSRHESDQLGPEGIINRIHSDLELLGKLVTEKSPPQGPA